MTESNHTTGTDAGGAGAQVIWPALPLVPDEANAPGDPAVTAFLDRLVELPELPVALHAEVYAGLHDDLLAALDEDVAASAGGQSAVRQSTPGTTTETEDATHEQA